jgi:signal transduction histidine kinase
MFSGETSRSVIGINAASLSQPQSIIRQLVVGVIVATFSAIGFTAVWGIGMDTLALLTALMLGTGLVSIGLGYVLYQKRMIRLMPSLNLSLVISASVTIVILSVNILVVSLSMLFSELDSLIVAALLIFAAILVVIFGGLHSRLITQELRDLTRAVNEVASGGGLQRPLPRAGHDEIANLVAAFNHMAQTLQEAEQKKAAAEQLRRDLVAWVSHDLRAPLTALRVMNEALVDGIADDAERSLYLHDMNREIISLSHLIDSLFELSLIDSGQAQLACQSTSLRDLLSATVSGIAARAAQAGVRLQTAIDDDIDPIDIDPEKVQRALVNILDNALQHTEAGGDIQLAARREETSVLITIFNSGSWIAEGERRQVFEGFYRGDQARSDAADRYRHAGLGLTIAQRFVEAHGGSLWADSRKAYGTTFSIRLPYR